MSDLIAQLTSWAESIMLSLGYVGIAFVIALEVIIPPIPSEVLLPLAGNLAAKGELNFFLVILAATIGSVGGSSALYGASRWAGERRVERWIERYGKWLLVSTADLHKSRRWFGRYGSQAVFLARLVPGMRSIISVPAGLSSMKFEKFLLYTTIGSLVWNTALVGAGAILGESWKAVEGWIDPISPFIYAAIILAVLLFVGKRLYDRFRPSPQKSTE